MVANVCRGPISIGSPVSDDLGPDVPLSVGGFIRQAIGEGLGVTAARNLFRSQGVGAMSNAAFGQLYGQIRTALGGRDQIAALDYNALPDAGVYTPWAAGEADRYATFVEVAVREVGSRTITSKFHTHVSDAPHTPQEAVEAAVATITAGNESGVTPSNEVVLDATVTSMTRTVRRAA